MGNHNSTICHSSNGQVAANPDVAGIGIIVSFAASTVLVLVAVLYGYFRDSLPETTLTRFDYYLLSHLPSGLGSKIDGLEKWIYSKITAKLKRWKPRIFGYDNGRVLLSPEEVRKRRKDSLERFVLSLGDQQLVTGLAVLIAGYSQMWSMSAYHFNIVASLAWFSSATHLATLAVSKNYLREYTTVRNWRVLFMLVLSIMLGVAQVPGRADKDNSVPVICYYKNFDDEDTATVLAAILFLLITYLEGIFRLYARDIDWNLRDFCVERIVLYLSKVFFADRYSKPSYLSTAQASEYPGTLSSRRSVAIVRSEREKGRFDRFESNLKSTDQPIKRYLFVAIFMYQELGFSFFVTMAFLLADLTYGFAQLFKYRAATPHGGIVGNQDEVSSFGQLVPLFLLVLPILTMGEIYSENHATIEANKNTSVAEASVSTGSHLRETSNSEKDTNEQSTLANATADESPSTAQASNVDSTSLKRFLDSFGPVTIPLAASRSKSSITLDRIEYALPQRAWTGNPSRGTQEFKFEPLMRSSTAGHTPRVLREGRVRATWPNPSFDIPHLRRPAARSLESADDAVSNHYPNIKYGNILGGIVACHFTCEIVVALAAASVFNPGEDDNSNKTFPLTMLLSLFLWGVSIGVNQRIRVLQKEKWTIV